MSAPGATLPVMRTSLLVLACSLVACGSDAFTGGDGAAQDSSLDARPSDGGTTGYCADKVFASPAAGYCEGFDDPQVIFQAPWLLTKCASCGLSVMGGALVASAPQPTGSIDVQSQIIRVVPITGPMRKVSVGVTMKVQQAEMPEAGVPSVGLLYVTLTQSYALGLLLDNSGGASLYETRPPNSDAGVSFDGHKLSDGLRGPAHRFELEIAIDGSQAGGQVVVRKNGAQIGGFAIAKGVGPKLEGAPLLYTSFGVVNAFAGGPSTALHDDLLVKVEY